MRIYIETIISIIALLCMAVLGYHIYTYDNMHMMYMTSKVTLPVALLVFGGLFLFEESGDERIREHQKRTDRIALLITIVLLGAMITYQVFTSMVDPKLVLLFICIILTKVILRWYYYLKN